MENLTFPPELQAFFMNIALMVITILVPILFGVAVAYSIKLYQQVKLSLSAQQQVFIRGVAQMAVLAAEQSGLKELIKNTGKEKLAYALNYMQAELEQHGLGGIKLDVLKGAIEAALREELHKPIPPLEKRITAKYKGGMLEEAPPPLGVSAKALTDFLG